MCNLEMIALVCLDIKETIISLHHQNQDKNTNGQQEPKNNETVIIESRNKSY